MIVVVCANSGCTDSTQNNREHLYEALDYVAKGKVRVMTEILPLEEISNVYDKVADGDVRFLCSCDDCIFGIFVK